VLLGDVLFDRNGICREGGNAHGPRKAITPEKDEGEYSQAKSRAARTGMALAAWKPADAGRDRLRPRPEVRGRGRRTQGPGQAATERRRYRRLVLLRLRYEYRIGA